jgi:hypothetical protein
VDTNAGRDWSSAISPPPRVHGARQAADAKDAPDRHEGRRRRVPTVTRSGVRNRDADPREPDQKCPGPRRHFVRTPAPEDLAQAQARHDIGSTLVPGLPHIGMSGRSEFGCRPLRRSGGGACSLRSVPREWSCVAGFTAWLRAVEPLTGGEHAEVEPCGHLRPECSILGEGDS